MRNVYIISILIILFIGIGCVGKNTQQTNSGELPTATTVVENTRQSLPEINVSPKNTPTTNNAESNTSVTDNTATVETVQNTSTGAGSVSTNDTSTTEIFKIGEEKKMLDKNIKLISIIDYDNNTVILTIDGVEYEYNPDDSSIQSGNIEVVDIITSAEDNTAEITVDYIK
jgi:hypothetical protein